MESSRLLFNPRSLAYPQFRSRHQAQTLSAVQSQFTTLSPTEPKLRRVVTPLCGTSWNCPRSAKDTRITEPKHDCCSDQTKLCGYTSNCRGNRKCVRTKALIATGGRMIQVKRGGRGEQRISLPFEDSVRMFDLFFENGNCTLASPSRSPPHSCSRETSTLQPVHFHAEDSSPARFLARESYTASRAAQMTSED
jgi:hypothetical protein